MDDIRETTIDHTSGQKTFSVFSSEYVMARRLRKLAEQYPDEVEIVAQNPDGSLLLRVPQDWVMVRRPRKRSMTDEQKAQASERLHAAREKKFNKEESNC